jgi:hypothetical protein
MRELIPAHAPEQGEHWSEVMKDIERVIMPGVTHWHHPQVLGGTLAPSTSTGGTLAPPTGTGGTLAPCTGTGGHTGTIHRY